MPIVSVNIDDDSFDSLKKESKRKRIPVGKIISDKINKNTTERWPLNYFDLFGSIKDEAFTEPNEITRDLGKDQEEF